MVDIIHKSLVLILTTFLLTNCRQRDGAGISDPLQVKPKITSQFYFKNREAIESGLATSMTIGLNQNLGEYQYDLKSLEFLAVKEVLPDGTINSDVLAFVASPHILDLVPGSPLPLNSIIKLSCKSSPSAGVPCDLINDNVVVGKAASSNGLTLKSLCTGEFESTCDIYFDKINDSDGRDVLALVLKLK